MTQLAKRKSKTEGSIIFISLKNQWKALLNFSFRGLEKKKIPTEARLWISISFSSRHHRGTFNFISTVCAYVTLRLNNRRWTMYKSRWVMHQFQIFYFVFPSAVWVSCCSVQKYKSPAVEGGIRETYLLSVWKKKKKKDSYHTWRRFFMQGSRICNPQDPFLSDFLKYFINSILWIKLI